MFAGAMRCWATAHCCCVSRPITYLLTYLCLCYDQRISIAGAARQDAHSREWTLISWLPYRRRSCCLVRHISSSFINDKTADFTRTDRYLRVVSATCHSSLRSPNKAYGQRCECCLLRCARYNREIALSKTDDLRNEDHCCTAQNLLFHRVH